MANHPSAIKRNKQARKRQVANQSAKARVRTLTRKVETTAGAGDAKAAKESLDVASRALAKAASKGLIHRKTASRRTSRLAKRVAKLSAK
ncbi:MAG: 30S ribosomal protein S20 [Myxococcota bacterium]